MHSNTWAQEDTCVNIHVWLNVITTENDNLYIASRKTFHFQKYFYRFNFEIFIPRSIQEFLDLILHKT